MNFKDKEEGNRPYKGPLKERIIYRLFEQKLLVLRYCIF